MHYSDPFIRGRLKRLTIMDESVWDAQDKEDINMAEI